MTQNDRTSILQCRRAYRYPYLSNTWLRLADISTDRQAIDRQLETRPCPDSDSTQTSVKQKVVFRRVCDEVGA